MNGPTAPRVLAGAALYLAVIQFVFVTCWTIYVIFLPVFWIAFNVAMFPGAALAKRYGALPVIAGASLAGAAGAFGSAVAGSLDALLAAQLLAGGAWGCT